MGLLVGGRPGEAFVPSPPGYGLFASLGEIFFCQFCVCGAGRKKPLPGLFRRQFLRLSPRVHWRFQTPMFGAGLPKHLIEISRNDFFQFLPPFDKSQKSRRNTLCLVPRQYLPPQEGS